MEQTTESDGKKRTYHSRVRQRQAEETRRRILAAARSQFENCGYAVTTLEAIAEVAEVSPKTIAAVFGSKRALLAEVINPEAFSTPRSAAHRGTARDGGSVTTSLAGGSDYPPGI